MRTLLRFVAYLMLLFMGLYTIALFLPQAFSAFTQVFNSEIRTQIALLIAFRSPLEIYSGLGFASLIFFWLSKEV